MEAKDDAGIVIVTDKDNVIYLFTESTASTLLQTISRALKNTPRHYWHNPNRIASAVFAEMIAGHDPSQFEIASMRLWSAWREVVIDAKYDIVTVYNHLETPQYRRSDDFERYISINWRK